MSHLGKIITGQTLLHKRYRLEKELGSGGMACVYKAMDASSRRPVAIKILTSGEEKAKKRFDREYRLLKAVDHPNLVHAYDSFEENGCSFMVLEFASGQSMADLLMGAQILSLAAQLSIANQTARAVEVLNTAGILHRDIKPLNIVVDIAGSTVKLLDLGAGKELTDEEQLTLPRSVLGTLPYLSPEQTKGNLSPQSDVFSLGTTLYQFFLWQEDSPFNEFNPLEVIHRIQDFSPLPLHEVWKKRPPTPLHDDGICRELSEIVAKAMEKSPHCRWQSAGHMADGFALLQRKLLSTHGKSLDRKNVLSLSGSIDVRTLKTLKELREHHEPRKKIRRYRRQKAPQETPWRWIAISAVVALFLFIGIFIGSHIAGSRQAEEHFYRSLYYYSRTKFARAWDENERACAIDADPRYLVYKARMFFYGRGTEKNLRLADELARRQLPYLLENDDAYSQFAVGHMYRNGYGVERDYHKALAWHRKAAEGGNALAMINLAVMHKNGEGVPRDYEKAVAWYEKAIAQGDSLAMLFLGNLYERDLHNYEKARRYYQAAAELGNNYAMTHLGLIYLEGLGVRQDHAAAGKWLHRAASLDNAEAMTILGNMYKLGTGVERNLALAEKWYRKAAELGDPHAMTSLGVMYANGFGAPRDYAMSIKWLRKAAQAGDANAMANLGIMYARGYGVEKDYAEAISWYNRARGKPGAEQTVRRLRKLLGMKD